MSDDYIIGVPLNKHSSSKKKKLQISVKTEEVPLISGEPEVKKMKQGMSYTCKEKTIILNVFKYFKCQYPEKCVTDIVRRTARATGCSEKSIFQFRKEEASIEGFKEPSKTKIRKNININSRDIKYDNTVRTTIRNIIYNLQYKNIVPSLNTILKQLKANEQMPKFSLMTLRRLMFDMGFSYQKNGNKAILVEKPDDRFMQQPNQNEHSLNSKPITASNQPINVPIHLGAPIPSQHDPNLMGPSANHVHDIHMMHHKNSMPIPLSTPMVMNSRMGPTPLSIAPDNSMDMHRKREPMAPWMHGIIKQGQ